MSQKKLAEAIGVTFQQVQKYERGASRVSAGRLQSLALALGVPVSYFFDEAGLGPGDGADGPSGRAAAHESHAPISREAFELLRAYCGIPDPEVRCRLSELTKAIAKACAEHD